MWARVRRLAGACCCGGGEDGYEQMVTVTDMDYVVGDDQGDWIRNTMVASSLAGGDDDESRSRVCACHVRYVNAETGVCGLRRCDKRRMPSSRANALSPVAAAHLPQDSPVSAQQLGASLSCFCEEHCAGALAHAQRASAGGDSPIVAWHTLERLYSVPRAQVAAACARDVLDLPAKLGTRACVAADLKRAIKHAPLGSVWRARTLLFNGPASEGDTDSFNHVYVWTRTFGAGMEPQISVTPYNPLQFIVWGNAEPRMTSDQDDRMLRANGSDSETIWLMRVPCVHARFVCTVLQHLLAAYAKPERNMAYTNPNSNMPITRREGHWFENARTASNTVQAAAVYFCLVAQIVMQPSSSRSAGNAAAAEQSSEKIL